MGFDPNKREFRDALHLWYDWSIPDKPAVCVCGDNFDTYHAMICKRGDFITMRRNELRDLEAELLNTVFKDVQIEPVLQVCVCGDNFDTDHAMICKRGDFITMRRNELRDLEAELLNTVCKDVQIEPVLQAIIGEVLNPGANKSADARPDIHARGFWEKSTSAFFDVRVCHRTQCRYVPPPQPKANIQDARTRKETSVRNQSLGSRKRNFCYSNFHHNWRNGRRVSQIP